jgi:hypothetical protein
VDLVEWHRGRLPLPSVILVQGQRYQAWRPRRYGSYGVRLLIGGIQRQLVAFDRRPFRQVGSDIDARLLGYSSSSNLPFQKRQCHSGYNAFLWFTLTMHKRIHRFRRHFTSSTRRGLQNTRFRPKMNRSTASCSRQMMQESHAPTLSL